MNYNCISLHKTEFDENYILLYDNQTLSVGYIVKIILEYLQKNILEPNIIRKKILLEENLDIDIYDIKIVIEKINTFLRKKNNQSFTKIIKIFNPSLINLKTFDYLFNHNIFYILFSFTFFINMIFTNLIINQPLNSKHYIYWLLLTFLILFIHEMGHAISANKFNVKCNEIGLGIYLIFPVLYVNIGESWKLKRHKRIIINLSGIYFQLIIGVFIGFIAFFFKYSLLSHLFFTNLTILLLNLNPLIKFDGYWVLSDLMDTKNLSKKADEALKKIKKFDFSFLKMWIIFYSLLRTLFFLYIIYFLIQLLIQVFYKIIRHEQLTNYQYLIILIIFTVIIKKIKNGFKTS